MTRALCTRSSGSKSRLKTLRRRRRRGSKSLTAGPSRQSWLSEQCDGGSDADFLDRSLDRSEGSARITCLACMPNLPQGESAEQAWANHLGWVPSTSLEELAAMRISSIEALVEAKIAPGPPVVHEVSRASLGESPGHLACSVRGVGNQQI
jgi:hypothetical protein